MPELPEVETVCRGLRQTVMGETISRVQVNAPPSSVVVGPSFNGKPFADLLRGRTIHGIDRRGKNIFMSLTGDITLWVHLKMTGRFLFVPRTLQLDKHDLVIFDFKSSLRSRTARHLRFRDYRRFGRHRLFLNHELWEQQALKTLGPEPLEITAEEFVVLCRRRHRMIKPALLDQSFLAGIGNIYADESLYAARIHPRRLTTSLSRKKLSELHGHIRRLLRKAIRLMGTTVDSYSGINGQTGRFQKYLLVYNHEGDPCPRCATAIRREKIGSRSSHFCPCCQRPS